MIKIRDFVNAAVMAALIIVWAFTLSHSSGAEPKLTIRSVSTAPVSRQMVIMPKPSLAWYNPYSAVLSKRDCQEMAELYKTYNNSKLSTNQITAMATILKLLSSDGGYNDIELHQLLYAVVFREGAQHPVKGLLEKRTKFKVEEVSEDSSEGKEFSEKMAAVLSRYGIE